MDDELSIDEKVNILFKKLYNKSSTNTNIPYYQEYMNQILLLYLINKFYLIKYQI